LASFGRIWLLFTYHLALSGSDHLATLAGGRGRLNPSDKIESQTSNRAEKNNFLVDKWR
jgi:hypothetical protein